jgi:hypothetical protein
LRDRAVIGEKIHPGTGRGWGPAARLCRRVGRTDSPRAAHDLAGAARGVLIYAPRCKPLLVLAIGDAVALDRFLDGGLGIRRIDPSDLNGRRAVDARDRPGVNARERASWPCLRLICSAPRMRPVFAEHKETPEPRGMGASARKVGVMNQEDNRHCMGRAPTGDTLFSIGPPSGFGNL